MKPKDMLVRVAPRPQGVKDDFKTVRVIKEDDDLTFVRVLVTTNGNPQAKDLHGTFFNQKTYFGDDIITTKFGVYEHFHNAWSNPFMPDPKMQLLGKATLAEQDDWGRWFDFELKRSSEYHNYIMKLIEADLMGASTQTYNGEGAYEKDDATGYISRWLENEVSMTPTPADYKTISMVSELSKAFNLPHDPKIWEFTPAPAKSEEEADLEEIVLDLLENGTEEVDDASLKSIVKLIKAQNVKIDTMKASIGVMIDMWGSIEDADKIFGMLGQIHSSTAEAKTAAEAAKEASLQTIVKAGRIEGAMTGMAGHIGNALKIKVQEMAEEESKKSTVEKRVEDDARTRAPGSVVIMEKGLAPSPLIPNNAPGG